MPTRVRPSTVPFPRTAFPGVYVARPGLGAVRTFGFSPRFSVWLSALCTALWYAILLLLDPRLTSILPTEEQTGQPPYWLLFSFDLLYAGGLLGLFSAARARLSHGGIRIDHIHDSVFFTLRTLWERQRLRKRISDIEEVVFVDGWRGGIFLCGDHSGFRCLQVAGMDRGYARQKEYSLWLAGWIGCSWCHLDRTGRIVAHLPCL